MWEKLGEILDIIFDGIVEYDQFILDKLEEFTDWFQIQTGRTCYFLERICWSIVICSLAYRLFWTKDFSGWDYYEVIVVSLVALISVWHSFKNDDTSSRLAISSSKKQSFPFSSVFRTTLSVMCLIEQVGICKRYWGGLPDFFTIFTDQRTIFFLMACYFEDCTPLPPGPSKIAQWLRSIFAPKSGETSET